MAVDTSALRSRRALLMTGVGSLAALAASALGRPSPVRAGSDGDVVLGAANVVATTTEIINNSNNDVVFAARSAPSSGGSSVNSIGILGHNVGGVGVSGTSLTHVGVQGGSWRGIGVAGHVSLGGIGVSGTSDGGGVGVVGTAPGIGVLAKSPSGNALKVEGRAVFSRSGRASVAAGRSHVDVTVGGDLDNAASILAVLQTRRSGVYVAGVRKNYPSQGKARIYLNKVASTSSSTVVAWLVIDGER